MKKINCEKKLIQLEEWYSEKFQLLKDCEAKKIEVAGSYKLPVPGLMISGEKLMIPNPSNGEIVELNSLSTGQKWAVAVAIHAAVSPKNKILFINDLNSLDAKNKGLLFEEAARHDIQLILHETLQVSDSQCNIIIQDSVEFSTTGGY
jgi:hypothetical protein